MCSRACGVAAVAAGLVAGELYCPGESDFQHAGGVEFAGNGWTMRGPNGVSGKTSFNLLGGYVSFDMDLTGAAAGVNTNLYTISPEHGFLSSGYCDIQDGDHAHCMEMDIIENNGRCAMSSTMHTWPNHNGDCDQAGCSVARRLPSSSFSVHAAFSEDGLMTVELAGAPVGGYSPWPSGNAKQYTAEIMRSIGASLWSSQWGPGYVPLKDQCPAFESDKSIAESVVKVANLRVMGTVVQGPEPSRCQGPPSPPPLPPPSPQPSPFGEGHCCWGSSCGAADCHADSWCQSSAEHCTGNCKGLWCSRGQTARANGTILV